VNSRGEGYGSKYGTAVHTDFANAVRGANLRGIGREGVERTYPEEDTRYGSEDTIRTDIVLRNDSQEVIAIYDVKTGNAYLDARRVKELRDMTGASTTVPVIEMHVRRGLSLKARGRYFWIITLRLWNPGMRDIADPRVIPNIPSARQWSRE
jgi:hypothetical protein